VSIATIPNEWNGQLGPDEETTGGRLPRLLQRGRKKERYVQEDCRSSSCYDGASERVGYMREEKNILYTASAVLYNPASSRRHGMGSQFIPRYTVHLLSPDSLLPLALFLPTSHPFDQHQSFFPPLHALILLALTLPYFRINREIVLHQSSNHYVVAKLTVLRWSYTHVRERDVDVASTAIGIARRTRTEIGPWM